MKSNAELSRSQTSSANMNRRNDLLWGKGVLGILISSLTLFSMVPSTSASLILTVHDLAPGFKITITGSIDTGAVPILAIEANTSIDELSPAGIVAGNSTGASLILGPGTVNTPLSSVVDTNLSRKPSQNTGSFAGYRDTAVAIEVDGSFTVGDTVFADADVTWPISILSAFGTNLDSGPVLLTTFPNGETVTIQRVPEPAFPLVVILSVGIVVFRKCKFPPRR